MKSSAIIQAILLGAFFFNSCGADTENKRTPDAPDADPDQSLQIHNGETKRNSQDGVGALVTVLDFAQPSPGHGDA